MEIKTREKTLLESK